MKAENAKIGTLVRIKGDDMGDTYRIYHAGQVVWIRGLDPESPKSLLVNASAITAKWERVGQRVLVDRPWPGLEVVCRVGRADRSVGDDELPIRVEWVDSDGETVRKLWVARSWLLPLPGPVDPDPLASAVLAGRIRAERDAATPEATPAQKATDAVDPLGAVIRALFSALVEVNSAAGAIDRVALDRANLTNTKDEG